MDYSSNYRENSKQEFVQRRDSIYLPKIKFLLEALLHNDIEKDNIHILDIGAGAGYFVSAALNSDIKVEGIEISEQQVVFGNTMMGEKALKNLDSDAIVSYIRENKDCNLISAIGVFEHITNLDEIIGAIKDNPAIQYVYASVPLFSYSCVLEATKQNVFNRHLGGGHTHLFTEKSVNYFLELLQYKMIGKWQFGLDVMDLYRFICVELEKNGNSQLKDYFSQQFVPLLDSLQFEVDQRGFCSEIHFLAMKK